jgi:lipid kinase YegS
LILHGERALAPELRELVARVRAAGHTVLPRVTWESGDGTRFTRDLVGAGIDTAIAGGGDGTVNEVLNGLTGSETALGILPLGTANDFAVQAGIPSDLAAAMEIILSGEPVRIDTATLNGRRFLNVSTGGIGAEATAETSADTKATFGPIAYALTALRKLTGLQARRARFEGPDWSFESNFLVFAVGNTRATGGGRAITPGASVRDGLLDLCVVEDMRMLDFARISLLIGRGEHVAQDGVHYVQTPRVRITTAAPITVNADGEPMEGHTLEYQAHRRDLRIYLPPTDKAAEERR